VDEASVLRIVPPDPEPARGSARAPEPRPATRRRTPSARAADARPVELAAAADRPPSEAESATPEPSAIAPPADPVPLDRTAVSSPQGVPSTWERQLAIALDFWRRRLTGEYEVDEFGFDPDLTENVLVPLLRPVYHTWFRTEVIGVHNLPRDGGALLVANHAGGLWAIDGAMTAIAVHETHPNHRYLRMLGADLLFTTPVLGPLARKTGSTLACNADAERLLNQGELVGVWPEGFKGIGKPFSERYKLQRFGRGGFVSAALRSGVPIIPVSIVGSEEVHPVLGHAKTLARILNLPYFPLTPTFPWLGPLGLVPLPVKWYIEFGEPIATADYEAHGADDPMLVFELTDRVREIIQSTLYRLLMQRRSVWR
jgi:1-acyl-sn-glycerol-3-phosphate acyltransferase